MTRAQLLPSIMEQRAQHGPIKIYIGKNSSTKLEGSPTIHYTDEFEEGEYFYGPDGGFQLLYPHARPIGVIDGEDASIFWGDEQEAMTQLAEDLATQS